MRHDYASLRRNLGLSQTAFWEPVGVTQTASSRYENGSRPIPRSVLIVLAARYLGQPVKPYRSGKR